MSDLNLLNRNFEKLEEEVREAGREVLEKEGTIKTATKERSDLEEQIKIKDEAIADREKQIEALRAEMLRPQATAARKDASQSISGSVSLDLLIRTKDAEIKDDLKKIVQLQSDIRNAQEEIRKARADQEKQKSDERTARVQSVSAQQIVKSKQALIKVKEAEIKRLTTEIQLLQNKIRTIEQTEKNASGAMALLKNNLQIKRSELEHARQVRDDAVRHGGLQDRPRS